MKQPIVILILGALFAFQVSAQCPVTAPTANTALVDGGSPNCDAGTYLYFGQVASSSLGTCFRFSGSSCGIAYYGSTYSLNCGFCVSFNFTLSTLTSDGIAFTMADFSQTPSGNPCSSPLDACASGGNIGYNTFNNLASNLNGGGALTVEFDPFDNTAQGDADLVCDHVAIVEDGNNNAFISRACSPVNLDNGTTYSANICWDPALNRLTVSINGTTVLTLNQNIRSYFTGTNVHFAFSSGYNPSFVGANTICNWTVTPFGTPLPSDNMYLSGETMPGHVKLDWNALLNSSVKYEVLRSKDAVNFERVAELVPTETGEPLTFLDDISWNGSLLYKVQARDLDGNVWESNVLTVDFSASERFLVSQDANGLSIVDLQGKEFKVKLSDARGRILISETGTSEKKLALGMVSDGLLILEIESGNDRVVRKLAFCK